MNVQLVVVVVVIVVVWLGAGAPQPPDGVARRHQPREPVTSHRGATLGPPATACRAARPTRAELARRYPLDRSRAAPTPHSVFTRR
ncbi:hypothetical protein EVAR_77205_1 [Eumeta japonica]|uniref:Secreted protein n=1 Tax=Eumeta variegata TaxID=151549 RepID=A0A4C1T4N6_EUMVA|nr:hypothetical protein EVAR_77205_1 [Eumeta japonica]